MGYQEALDAINKYGETATADVNTNMDAALAALSAKSQEASDILSQLEGSDVADAQKWVSTARGQIDQSVGTMLDTMVDLGQRGGMRGGMPGLKSIVESTVSALTPITAQLTQQAMTTKAGLGTKQADLASTLGVQQAGLYGQKAGLLSNVGQNVASETAGVEKQKMGDEAAIERAKEQVRVALAIGGTLMPQSTTSVLGSYGVDPNLSKIYGAQNNGGSSGSGGVSQVGNGGGSTGTASDPIASYISAKNLYNSSKYTNDVAGMSVAKNVVNSMGGNLGTWLI